MRTCSTSRTTVAQLLARNLDDDYGVVLAVTHHRLPAAAGGEVEFLVTFDGSTTPVYQPASGLTQLSLFKEYVAAHSLSPAMFELAADWKPQKTPRDSRHAATAASKRGRGRGSKNR